MSKILVTNDDGIHALGLQVLAEALQQVGEVTVVAPEREQSAVGHAITMHKPLRVRALAHASGRWWAVEGTPADCVGLGIRKLVPGGLDLVVAGINQGANLGEDVLYSGTVSAATEAVILGVPAFAVSNISFTSDDYRAAAAFAVELAERLLKHPLPLPTFLNVNVPELPPERIAGVRVTRQGWRVYRSTYIERIDPRGRPYYWLGAERPEDEPVPGTDIAAVQAGYIAVTPQQPDLTAHERLAELVDWWPEGKEGPRP